MKQLLTLMLFVLIALPAFAQTSICAGEEYTLTVPTGNTGEWYKDNVATGNTTLTYIVTTAGVYDFRGTSGGCATASCANITFVNGPCATIGNYVWLDANSDGLQAGEAGINGVVVELWKETTPGSGTYAFVRNTTTANNGTNDGAYLFNVSEAANYKIKFPTTSGINILTTQTATAATDGNSDADATGNSPAFAMDPAGTGIAKDNMTLDAGFKSSASCVCTGNMLTNPSFEGSDLSAWTVGTNEPGGSLFSNTTPYAVCGSEYGYIRATDNGHNPPYLVTIYQDIAAVAGNTYNLSAYAGTHDIAQDQQLYLEFYNSSNVLLSGGQSVQVDTDVDAAPFTLGLYNLSGVAPAGTAYVRVKASTQGIYTILNTAFKFDAFCLTTVAPVCTLAPPALTITSLGFGPGSAPTAENVTTNGSFPLNESNVAGFYMSPTSEGNFYAFCTEISQPILPIQNPYTHEFNGSANGFTNAVALRMAQVVQAAGFNGTTGFASGNTVAKFVALQFATWNAIYDTDYSVTAGNFQALTDNNAARTLANTWLTAAQAITTPTVVVHTLHNATGQDLLIIGDVPPIKLTTTQPTCSGAGAPNNGGITISTFTAGQRYQYSAGTTFNSGAATPASITAIPTGGVITSTLANTTGSYVVRVYDATNDACYTDRTATIVAAVCVGSVGNYVWNDTNGNGLNDEPASAGINGVTVELWNNDTNTLVSSTTTANNGGNAGYYNFVVTASGNYYVKFPTTNATHSLTTATTTAATDLNSDAATATGNSPVFAIDVNGTGTAKDNPTIDAAYYTCPTFTPSVSNVVANDNGTATVSTDDYIGFLLAPDASGNGLGTTYSVTATQGGSPITVTLSNGTAATGLSFGYPSPLRTPTGTAGQGNITITITSSRGCTATLVVTDPGVVAYTPCTSGTTTYNYRSPFDFTNLSSAPVLLPKFDNAGGTRTLTGATLTYNVKFGSIGLYENQAASTSDVDYTLSTTARYVLNGTQIDLIASAPNTVSIPNVAIAIDKPNGAPANAWPGDSFNGTNFTTLTKMQNLGLTEYLRAIYVNPTASPYWITNITGNAADDDDFAVFATQTFDTPSSKIYSAPVDLAVLTGTGNIPMTVTTTVPFVIDASAGNGQSTRSTKAYIEASIVYTYATTCAGSVGNYVWNDTNGNGTNDEPASAGINGVDVQLWSTGADGALGGTGLNADTQVGATLQTANDGSGNPGYYNFVVTTSGNYFIVFPTTTPAALGANGNKVLTTQNTASQTDNNSDANTSTGSTITFDISINGAGMLKDNPTLDAGYKCNAVATITGAATVCVSPNTVLTATLTSGGTASTYLWDDATTGATITVNPSSSTTYSVTITAANGCTATSTLTVEPTPTIIGISAVSKLCEGSGTTLTGSSSGATGYVWNTGATTPSISVAPVVTTLYTVTASYANGCTATATVNLEVLSPIIVSSVVKANPTTCVPANGSLTVNATGSASTPLQYRLTGAITTAWGSSNTFTGLAAGNYLVQVRYQGGYCAFIYGVETLTAPVPPTVNILTDCSGTNTVLTATGATTYVWNTGATTDIITISTATTYTVTATDAGGCTASTTIAAVLLPCKASLGDRVWLDTNKDGTQDAGEVGVSGVTVTLYNNTGIAVSATKTDAYGKYLFDNLAPGNYTVGFSLPANYVFSPEGSRTDSGTATDSDAEPLSGGAGVGFGRSGVVALSAGEQDLKVDAGIYFAEPSKQSIGDYVWFDDNSDGIQNPLSGGAGVGTEKGISGVTVTLYDATGSTVIATTITDGTGKYLFDNLPTGSYVVGFSEVPGFVFTTQTTGTADGSDADAITGKTGVITLASGDNPRDIDAGLVAAASIKGAVGDKVWYDTNNNGIQDANEGGVAGVTVNLLDATNSVVATTTTDAFGNYLFNNLDAGRYKVEFVVATLPSGFTLVTKDAAGSTDNNDSDADATTGKTIWFALAPGEKNLTIDAGIYNTSAPTGGLGNYVWFDADKDGIQDANEAGLGGVTVTLYASNGTTVIATTVTDKTGYYAFNNLPAADYVVGFTNTPTGFVFTTQTNGTGTGSDANASTGKTPAITVGTSFRDDIDAGLYPAGSPSGKGSLGNYVWYDTNDNGLQEAGEVGVNGITVNLLNATTNAILSTQKTDATGHYLFTGLDKGDYKVEFVTATLPSGFGFTTKDAGTNDAIDTDVNAGTGKTDLISLAQGEDNLTVDAGIYNIAAPTGAIGNFVWNDLNGDGIQNDGANSGVQGVSVVLYAADGLTIVATTTTDSKGYYLFPNLALATYTVGFGNLPDGFVFTTPESTPSANGSDANTSTGKTPTITLTSGSPTNMDTDAGIRSTTKAGLGDYVWLDANGNGIQEPLSGGAGVGEKPLAGVTVTLYLSDGTKISNAITDASGYYSFINLDPSVDYIVGFSDIPLGATFTKQETGSTANGSDADPITGKTDVIHLAAGEFNSTIDAGVTLQKAGLGDYVWLDANANGLQEPLSGGAGAGSENGVAGVVVILHDAVTGDEAAKTVTDGKGYYSFTNLNPGTYYVEFLSTSLPVGATFTSYTSGTANGSDADPFDGTTADITLAAGDFNPNIDAGIVQTKAALGDFVWIDADKNGIQNDGESPLAGVVVTLRKASDDSVVDTQTTNAKGFYWFDNLPAGNYIVAFGGVAGNSRTTAAGQIGGSTTGETLLYNSDADATSGRTASIPLAAGERNPNIDAGYYVTPLPVKLLYVKANADGCTVHVLWATATEQNAKSFEVWRSEDGIRYTKIGEIHAVGNSNTPQYYTFEDNKPFRTNFYKLVETDFDGRSETFNLASKVILNNCNDLTEGISGLYPNPNSTNAVTLRFYTAQEAQITNFVIHDIVGREMSSTKVPTTTGINTIELDITTLTAGTYTIKVLGDGWYSTAQKLVIVR